jgi:tetratricopeptide (TPR) repeat protein
VPKKRPHAEGLTSQYLREERGLSKKELAQELGQKNDDLLSKQERGDREMSRETLDWTLAPLKHFPEAVDLLLFAHRLIAPERYPETAAVEGLTPEELRRIDRTVLGAVWTVAESLRAELIWKKKLEKAAAERREAEELLALLLPCTAEERRDLVTVYPQFWSCALLALVCEESVKAAAHKVAEALELANFARFIARRIPGEGRRLRALGYALGFIANAQRVANDFDASDLTFRDAWEIWKAGTAADPDPLAEWRLLDLEASLRRAQHRFPEALELLDRARAACGDGSFATGRILMQKSNVLEQKGDFAGALAALEEAAPSVEASGDPYLLFGLLFNKATDFCFLESYAEAEALLQEIRDLAVQQANELGLLRVLWLGARVAAGLGRGEESMAALEQVRGDFTDHELPYDAALSSLDLAVLWLERGRMADVRELAVNMAWIFKAKGIHREALAALTVFCEAARQEAATVELTRRVIADVEKVQRLASPRQMER